MSNVVRILIVLLVLEILAFALGNRVIGYIALIAIIFIGGAWAIVLDFKKADNKNE